MKRNLGYTLKVLSNLKLIKVIPVGSVTLLFHYFNHICTKTNRLKIGNPNHSGCFPNVLILHLMHVHNNRRIPLGIVAKTH